MKKALIFTVIIFIIVSVTFVVILRMHSSTNTGTGTSTVTFPNSGTSGVRTSTSTGSATFLDNPDVHPDQNNPGYYDVRGASTASSTMVNPYSIRYIAATDYFNIVLLEEPIGESRQRMQSYLMTLLGLTKDQMCSLNYAVYVPNDVNTTYSGMNLGFSFCPGAVPLPQ